MYLRYTLSGHAFISPKDNPDKLVDALLASGYNEECCLALDFTPSFVSRLMAAGFLVMSISRSEPDGENTEEKEEQGFLLLPKLHLIRSVLFFPDLHIKKSVRRLLNRYELRFDTDFDRIVDKCIAIHGDDWLTKPLIDTIKSIRKVSMTGGGAVLFKKKRRLPPVRPVSFGVYRNGELLAGEFGVSVGRVYTSYSGYYDESSAGTAQIVLMTRYLEDAGFAFLDFGMPLDYKTDLGATNIGPDEFVRRFRESRQPPPSPTVP
ncbi:MAG: GNAT family N-acetyltransferase [Spirochaetaceae bacterium]|jgi:Leu/Phe-tRNA-protein transferase|nr:GNAT family N-acetyltransferase [Spirochaetaceae bacterium]